MSLLFNIRQPTPDDINFILNSWLKSNHFRYHNYFNDGDYFKYYKDHIVKLLQESTVTILCNQEDENQIYGYSVVEGICVHYVYIKYSYRKLGLAKYLLKDVTESSIQHVLFPYNPYILLRKTI